jgi:hypothetical protein
LGLSTDDLDRVDASSSALPIVADDEPIGTAETMAVPSVGASAPATLPTPEAKAEPARRHLVLLAGGLGAAILLTAGAVAGVWLSQDKPPPLEEREVGRTTNKPIAAKPSAVGFDPDASALRSKKGRKVVVESVPLAHLFYKGRYVGDTPLSTTLAPGEYAIELDRHDERRRASLRVERGSYTQRVTLVLSELEPALTKGPRKPRSKSSKSSGASKGKNLMRKIKGIFQ